MPFFDFDDHFLGQMEWANLNKGATKVGHSQCHILGQAKIPFGNPNLPTGSCLVDNLSPLPSGKLSHNYGKIHHFLAG
jgi:hypothetical protein